MRMSLRRGVLRVHPAAIVASDPEPVFPGLSTDDVLTVYWTKATSRPDVTTTDRLNALLSFSPPLATILRATWQDSDGGVVGAEDQLVITLSGSVSNDVLGTIVPAVRVSVLPGGGLRDAGGASQNMAAVNVTVRGSWGDASQPQFLSGSAAAIALDYGGQPGLGPGDAVLLRFNQPVAQVPVATREALDAVRYTERACPACCTRLLHCCVLRAFPHEFRRAYAPLPCVCAGGCNSCFIGHHQSGLTTTRACG